MDYNFCTDLTYAQPCHFVLFSREKQAQQLSNRLNKPLTAQRSSHRLTIEPKISNRYCLVPVRRFPVPLGRMDHVTRNALAARKNEA